MSDELKPFDEIQQCPKCRTLRAHVSRRIIPGCQASQDVVVSRCDCETIIKFRAVFKSIRGPNPYCHECSGTGIRARIRNHPARPNRLQWECRCGMEWISAPADAEE